MYGHLCIYLSSSDDFLTVSHGSGVTEIVSSIGWYVLSGRMEGGGACTSSIGQSQTSTGE